MNDPLDLGEFLLARIAEDEAVARVRTEDRKWYPGPTGSLGCIPLHAGAGTEDDPLYIIGWCYGSEDAVHIARHDPARVLAECEAKRKLLDWHRQYNTDECGEPHGREDQCPTWRLLAAPYADHPDYNPSWTPR